MWHDKLLSVSKIENGYLVEIRVPFKKKENPKREVYEEPYGEKEIFVGTSEELGSKIVELMPLLETEYEGEKAFEAAFTQAAKGK